MLDASVAIAALRDSEPAHVSALRRCMPLFAGRDEIVVPAIFDLEVMSALRVPVMCNGARSCR